MRDAVSLVGALALGWLLVAWVARVAGRAVRRGVRVALLRLPGQAPKTLSLPRWLPGYVLLSGIIASAAVIGIIWGTTLPPGGDSVTLIWALLAAFVFIAALWPVFLLWILLFVLAGEGPRPWR